MVSWDATAAAATMIPPTVTYYQRPCRTISQLDFFVFLVQSFEYYKKKVPRNNPGAHGKFPQVS